VVSTELFSPTSLPSGAYMSWIIGRPTTWGMVPNAPCRERNAVKVAKLGESVAPITVATVMIWGQIQIGYLAYRQLVPCVSYSKLDLPSEGLNEGHCKDAAQPVQQQAVIN
jgi:hypothetical protein